MELGKGVGRLNFKGVVMSDKKQKSVTYNKICVEPTTRLGAPMDEVLERRKKMLADHRKNY
jgi:hypothetical protein